MSKKSRRPNRSNRNSRRVPTKSTYVAADSISVIELCLMRVAGQHAKSMGRDLTQWTSSDKVHVVAEALPEENVSFITQLSGPAAESHFLKAWAKAVFFEGNGTFFGVDSEMYTATAALTAIIDPEGVGEFLIWDVVRCSDGKHLSYQDLDYIDVPELVAR